MDIVHEHVTPSGLVRIMKARSDGSVFYYQGDAFHNHAGADGISYFPYIHAMNSIIAESGCNRVAVLGSAGGSLPALLAKAGKSVTAVDADPFSFAAAKAYFQLPEAVNCVVSDARQFLEETAESFEAISFDIYHGHGMPDHMYTTECFRLARSRLAREGIILANVIVDHDLDPRADIIAAGIRSAGLPVIMFDPGGVGRNIILLGGAVHPLPRLIRGGEPPRVLPELRRMKPRHARRLAPSRDSRPRLPALDMATGLTLVIDDEVRGFGGWLADARPDAEEERSGGPWDR